MNDKHIVRYNPSYKDGLNSTQLKERIKNNLVNHDTSIPTKSIKNIISSNIFTLFNLINTILAVSVFLVGSYKNLLFMGVVISNIIISTFQEIRAKITIDKLSLITSPKVKVIRNGQIQNAHMNDIVLDDIIMFGIGNQVVSDSIIVSGECEVNESFITGESESIYKKKGDMILSGSFIVSGNVYAKVEHIGDDNYTSSISKDAKYLKKVDSEILNSLKSVIKFVSIVIIPMGLLLFYSQFNVPNVTIRDAVINTVAAFISMIPEGLILLTSTVFAVSVIRLSKYKVLVQDLYCSESLARVDVLCLDKTGTITDGKMEVNDIVILSDTKKDVVDEILCNLSTALKDDNPTINAIRNEYLASGTWIFKKVMPFSSQRKWSGVYFDKRGTYVIGAPEFVLKDKVSDIKKDLDLYNKDNRVILLAHSNYKFDDDSLPSDIKPIAFILIKDRIRKDAIETLNYFKDANVELKIISGDSIETVSNIAKRVGIETDNKCIDATKLKNYNDIKEAVKKYSIFGRVTPFQKKQIVIALKENKHTVAMTGDGVNDCLALKEADCSIAMASGSDAARNVSKLVLLDSKFSSMPRIVKEGRRTVNNIQRSATLFLVKTIYSTILAFLFLFINMSYPFEPIQLTLTSIVTIGIPSFVLALEPNKEKIKGNFLINVISKAIPTAITIVINIIVIIILSSIFKITPEQTSTLCVILTAFTGFMLLHKLCRPFNLIRLTLFVSMITLFIVGILGLRTLFSMTLITPLMLFAIACLIALSIFIFNIIDAISNSFIQKNKTKIVGK